MLSKFRKYENKLILFSKFTETIAKDYRELWNKKVQHIAKRRYKKLVGYMILKRTYDSSSAMIYTAIGGYKDLVEFFITKGVSDVWNLAMVYSTTEHNTDLIDFFIQKGANDWGWALGYAARRNYKDLVNFFVCKIDREKNEIWKWVLSCAEEEGHKDIIKISKQMIKQ